MKPRILIVDDEELWLELLKEHFEDELSYQVDTAASLEEAVSLLKKQNQYHVVITDIGLTKQEENTDGIDVLKAAQKYSPNSQTIAVSGRAAKANKEQFKKAYHALEYFEREVLSDDLDRFVEKVAEGVAISLKEEERQRDAAQ